MSKNMAMNVPLTNVSDVTLEVKKMKFVKGVMIGGLLTTGLIMMYVESDKMNKKKLMKKGEQFARKMVMM